MDVCASPLWLDFLAIQAFFIKFRIEFNWRRAELRPEKVLKGHDDHVVS